MSLLPKVGKYNNIPEDLMPKLPEKGTVVVLEFTNFIIDHISGEKRWPMHYTLTPESSFRNPKTGESIPIKLIQSFDEKGVVSIRRVIVEPQKHGGCYAITIGLSADMDDIYRFIMLTSENADNPYRYDSVPSTFKLQNLAKKSEDKITLRRLKREALNKIDELEDEGLVRVATILGIGTNYEPSVIRDLVEEYAEKNPEQLLKIVDSPDNDLTYVIEKAIKYGIIVRKGASLSWFDVEGELVPLSEDKDEVVVSDFIKFINSSEQGSEIVARAKDLISEKEKSPKRGRKGNQ